VESRTLIKSSTRSYVIVCYTFPTHTLDVVDSKSYTSADQRALAIFFEVKKRVVNQLLKSDMVPYVWGIDKLLTISNR